MFSALLKNMFSPLFSSIFSITARTLNLGRSEAVRCGRKVGCGKKVGCCKEGCEKEGCGKVRSRREVGCGRWEVTIFTTSSSVAVPFLLT